MDVFFEQIVSIKKNGKQIFSIILFCLFAFLLAAFLFLTNLLGMLTLLAIFGIGWGTFKVVTMFNIEYEYIVTNSVLDVDRITNKSSRRRELSIDLTNVSSIQKYHPHLIERVNRKSVIFACNASDEGSFLLVSQKPGAEKVYLIFSPNDEIRSAIKKFAPKFAVDSAFK